MKKRNFLIVCLLGILMVFAFGLASCDSGIQEQKYIDIPGAYPGDAPGGSEIAKWVVGGLDDGDDGDDDDD